MNWKGHYINRRWIQLESDLFASQNPADNTQVWQGCNATARIVEEAVACAAEAFQQWSRQEPSYRIDRILKYERSLKKNRIELAQAISIENGKPLWESMQEVTSMIEKINISINAYQERCKMTSRNFQGYNAVTLFRPIGVLAVLGPYNLPGHLPHGHIIPALIAGNTVVFKPSELTPRVGEKMMELWDETDLPVGVINMIQGSQNAGFLLASNPNLGGLLFTGSYDTGKKIHQTFAGYPEKMLALEMGGNNPLIIWDYSSLKNSCYYAILSSFISSGQRCTCARRIIIPDSPEGNAFLDFFADYSSKISIGAWDDNPGPFMGPLVREKNAQNIIAEFNALAGSGGMVILSPKILDNKKSRAFVSPGIIDLTGIAGVPDREIFGPVVQIYRAGDFEEAIRVANHTSFGLSAGLISNNKILFEQFLNRSHAGIINWNRQITGASSSLPFGGVGKSGNFKPSAYFSTDYCSYSVGSLQSTSLEMPEKINPGLEYFATSM